MKDDDIMQEYSTLSENNRGAKGSSELLKNHYRATRGTITEKFIALQALASSGTTTDTEEDGVITTSDVLVVNEQCEGATKQMKVIVTQYDLHKDLVTTRAYRRLYALAVTRSLTKAS